MTNDKIERETLIAASIERVWTLVAEPGFWVADEGTVAGLSAVEGEEVLTKNTTYGDYPVRVEKVDPPTYLAYRWASAFAGQALTKENSTLIEFRLSAEGDQTRLRVVESGFAALIGGDELRTQAFTDNTQGWGEQLEILKSRVESAAV